VQLKDKIKKISVYHYLSNAFANHSCRFCIDVELSDYENLDSEEKVIANQYFYNSHSETGNQFVSFIYKSQRDYHIDSDIVKSFIYHYEFAQNLFENFIKKILPQTCILEIEPLDSELFFVYMISFLNGMRYSEIDTKEIIPFERKYRELYKRDFELDCYYHKILVETATPTLDKDRTISEKELCDTGNKSITNLRKFIIEEKIPFLIDSHHCGTIDEILIDIATLKDKLKKYTPKSSYFDIQPERILKLLNKKESEEILAKEKLDRICKAFEIQIGDYIYVKHSFWGGDNQYGIIKEVSLYCNDDLEIQYRILKNDMTESRVPLKTMFGVTDSDFYVLKKEMVEKEKKNGSLKTKQQLIALFNKNGVKNSLFKGKKRK
jgi:DNA-binding Xre family transcriptional regulator